DRPVASRPVRLRPLRIADHRLHDESPAGRRTAVDEVGSVHRHDDTLARALAGLRPSADRPARPARLGLRSDRPQPLPAVRPARGVPGTDPGRSGALPVTKLTVLVIGGYGTFGSRLCRLLADEPRLTLIVAGRSLEKAEAFCRRPSEATLIPAVFDRSADVAPLLAALRPGLVVDASGPFQAYGGDPYRIARAAIAVGADYLDLADGSDFVLGIDALDREARQAGRFVLSGASTVPALSGAVVRSLASNLSRIDGISVGISPSPHADLGESVVRAIATYAGKPVSMRKDGTAGCGTGIVTSRRHTI